MKRVYVEARYVIWHREDRDSEHVIKRKDCAILISLVIASNWYINGECILESKVYVHKTNQSRSKTKRVFSRKSNKPPRNYVWVNIGFITLLHIPLALMQVLQWQVAYAANHLHVRRRTPYTLPRQRDIYSLNTLERCLWRGLGSYSIACLACRIPDLVVRKAMKAPLLYR